MPTTQNRKYIIFPVVMICITLYATLVRHTVDSIFTVLDKCDFTGITTIFMFVLLFFEILVLALCVYRGVKGREDGYDYSYNSFFSILFLVLIILPILGYFIVGNIEKEEAEKTKQKQEEVLNLESNHNNKKTKTNLADRLQEYLDMESDKYYERKMQIITNAKDKSVFERFFYDYVLNFNTYTILPIIDRSKTMDKNKRYYAIYSRFSTINVLCFAFYFIGGGSDKRLNKKSIISRNNMG